MLYEKVNGATVFVPDENKKRLENAIAYIKNNNIVLDAAHSYAAMPGFCDVHVHLREPGFSYKETIFTGTLAAKHGGYTDVCSMPNLKPVPDSEENILKQINIIEKDANIRVHPYASITVSQQGEELCDFESLAQYAVAFSDDGKGVQSEEMMLCAMKEAKKLDKIIAAHCEVNELLKGGYIHDGEYARNNNHRGICSESEWKQIERDISLCEKTGVKYHVCHISTKESVDLIRKAKARGVNITCETGPHYLVLDDSCLQSNGRFKMNPPLRDKADKEALVQGILDGTIDMIATDHAPHSIEEKSQGLEKSLMGVVGLETAFPVIYTNFVRNGILTLSDVCKLMSENPRKRFNLPEKENEFVLWDLDSEYTVDPNNFKSMGRSTPFEGEKVYGKYIASVVEK